MGDDKMPKAARSWRGLSAGGHFLRDALLWNII